MKNFQQNLLIVVAAALCILCVWQWNDQTRQRSVVNDLDIQLSQKLVQIQEYTNTIRTMDGQIAQMDAHLTELQAVIKTNQDVILGQKRELNRADSEKQALTTQVAEYKKAVDELETKLKAAYEGIQKQNESFKELVAQRDDFVKRLNDSVKDRNEIVEKYNKLAAEFQKLQAPVKPAN